MIAGKSVSVIMPVYNEEKTVGEVAGALLPCPFLEEIIAVDDGSEDKSLPILQEFKGIRIIRHRQNRGKGAALASGIRQAKGEIVVFCDSDLVGMSGEMVKRLVRPVVSGKVTYAVGLAKKSKEWAIFDELAGTRAYWRRDLLPHLDRIEATRFGVEIFLNHAFAGKRKKVLTFRLNHYYKFEKLPANEAAAAYIKEVLEIIKEKALVQGWWNEDWNRQLEPLRSIRDWAAWERAVEQVKNHRLLKALQKYTKGYVLRVQKFLGIN